MGGDTRRDDCALGGDTQRDGLYSGRGHGVQWEGTRSTVGGDTWKDDCSQGGDTQKGEWEKMHRLSFSGTFSLTG